MTGFASPRVCRRTGPACPPSPGTQGTHPSCPQWSSHVCTAHGSSACTPADAQAPQQTVREGQESQQKVNRQGTRKGGGGAGRAWEGALSKAVYGLGHIPWLYDAWRGSIAAGSVNQATRSSQCIENTVCVASPPVPGVRCP